MLRYATCLASAVLLTGNLLSAESLVGNDGGFPLTQDARNAFQQIQNRAWNVAQAAATIEVTSPVLQPDFLNQIKDEIDYMQRQALVLAQEEERLSKSQREALSKETALLQDANKNADLALQYWNENSDHLRGDHTYHSYVRSIRKDGNEAVDVLKPVLGQPHGHPWRRLATLGFGW